MSNSLQMGSRGPGVAALQSKLNTALSLSPGLVADGAFGAKTAQAVRLFQQRNRLATDGVVGPRTAAALGLVPGGMPGPGGHGGPTPPPHPASAPPGFVDLSAFNVVIEAIIQGFQNIGARLISWVDSDDVPQFAYDRVESLVNGAVNVVVAPLRGITTQTVPLGQDPAAFVTDRIRIAFARGASNLSGALQPLLGLPVIGGDASRFQLSISGHMRTIDGEIAKLRASGQAAQANAPATAQRIAAAFESVARQIV